MSPADRSPGKKSDGIVPADYPPPFSPAEAIAAPTDPVD